MVRDGDINGSVKGMGWEWKTFCQTTLNTVLHRYGFVARDVL